MNNGRTYDIKNQFIESLTEWIRKALSPHGVMLKWFQVIPGTMIQVKNISYIRVLSDEEVEAINNLEPETEAQNDTGSADISKVNKAEENVSVENTDKTTDDIEEVKSDDSN